MLEIAIIAFNYFLAPIVNACSIILLPFFIRSLRCHHKRGICSSFTTYSTSSRHTWSSGCGQSYGLGHRSFQPHFCLIHHLFHFISFKWWLLIALYILIPCLLIRMRCALTLELADVKSFTATITYPFPIFSSHSYFLQFYSVLPRRWLIIHTWPYAKK